MNRKTLLFDLDNTLYDYDAAHAAGFHALSAFAREQFGLSEEAFAPLYREAMEEQCRRARGPCAAIHSRLIRFQIITERLGAALSLAPRMEGVYWSAFLDAVQPEPGTRETLLLLKAQGFPVGVATNMTADYQFRKLERLDLLDSLDFLLTSEEANAEKPEAAFFAACAEKAGCPAGSCVFIGDDWRLDIQGAQAAGMVPVWLSRAPQADTGRDTGAVPVIASLPALPGLLRTMD